MSRKHIKLTPAEQALLDGDKGEAARWAIEFQLELGQFFGAADFVPVRSAHIAADAEALRDDGIDFMDRLCSAGGRCAIPTTTNPRSVDFERADDMGQSPVWSERERRIVQAFDRMGARRCDTCINYQTVDSPLYGEHLAWGDTGTVIYANSVAGARSNFEAGPASVAAAITGRVPRYGLHLPEHRRATVRVDVRDRPTQRSDWGALGCLVGRRVNDYWKVPALVGSGLRPSADDLKHLGAAMASYGSVGMFHLVGVTPEARTAAEAFGGMEPVESFAVNPGDIQRVYSGFQAGAEKPDLVVFSAPQLSLHEIAELASLFDGTTVSPVTRVYVTTSAMVKSEAERLGYARSIEKSGACLLTGVCFYLMAPHELAEIFGYRTLVTDSAKLANIIAGYGFDPVFRPTSVCVEAAVTGKIPW